MTTATGAPRSLPALRVVRSQLLVLRRPAVLASLLGVLPALAVLATSLAFATADRTPSAPAPGERPALLLGRLAGADGMTAGFAATSSLLGLLVLVLFLSTTAGEHARGTLRVLLTREPRRVRLLAGQVAAVLLLTFLALALALGASVATAFVAADLREVPTDLWTTGSSLRSAAAAYLQAAAAATGYALLGACLGTLTRSVPVGLGIGLAWFLPLEHLVQNGWAGAGRWFPGLLMESVAAGGTSVSDLGRSLAVGGLVVLGVTVVATVDLRRRDVLS